MPVTMAEMQERALTGPVMDEEEFNLKYSQRLRRIVKEYGIEWPKEQIIPDGATADKIFQAAIDLMVENGFYHMDTKRVVHFTREEILQTAKTRPREYVLGEGKDAVTFRERTPESSFPSVVVGFGGIVTEDMVLPIYLSHALEPTCQAVMPPLLRSAWGMENKGGTPGELYTLVAETEYAHIIARRAGKPGMPFVEVMSATTPFAVIAPFAAVASYVVRGYAPTSVHLPCHVLADFKINWDRLNLAAFAQLFGVPTWNGAMVLLGAYARNAAEWAVAEVGATLGMLTYTNGLQCVIGPSDMQGQWSGRENLRAGTAAALAFERNVHLPVGLHIEGNAGACTDMVCYELAAQVLAYESVGIEFYWGALPGRGLVLNGSTGMETRVMGETANAVSGIGPDRANEILNRILERYESRLADPPKGKVFAECYDAEKIKPSDEYVKIWAEAKEDLGKLGLHYRY